MPRGCDRADSAQTANTKPALADVIVVTCNSAPYIAACLRSIQASRCRAIVVDNGSKDETLQLVRQHFPEAQIIANPENLGYGRACNIGFSASSAPYIVFANADVQFPAGSIAGLVEFVKRHSRVGVAAPQLIYPDGQWQLSYADTPCIWSGLRDATGMNWMRRQVRRGLWPIRLDRTPKEVPYVSGAVIALPRAAFEQIHGFDEQFYFYAEDSDLCIRLRKANWHVVFCPLTKVVHVGGGHSVRIDNSDKFARYKVHSLATLAQKHLPAWEARFYIHCQYLFFAILYTACCVIRCFLPPSTSSGVAARRRIFASYAKILRMYMKTGLVSFPPGKRPVL